MAWKRYTGNKYGSRKVEVDGVVFDSKREAARYQDLRLMEKAGEIRDLQRQVKYTLIPAQYEHPESTTKNGRGKCLERECAYIADFVYTAILPDCGTITVVEDTKGFKTKDYIIKRKLMLSVYGIQIQEI